MHRRLTSSSTSALFPKHPELRVTRLCQLNARPSNALYFSAFTACFSQEFPSQSRFLHLKTGKVSLLYYSLCRVHEKSRWQHSFFTDKCLVAGQILQTNHGCCIWRIVFNRKNHHKIANCCFFHRVKSDLERSSPPSQTRLPRRGAVSDNETFREPWEIVGL